MSWIDLKRAPTVGVEDLVMIPTLTDKAVMDNLKQRHAKDLIYTNIGSVLISVNPFKRIPIYGENMIEFYKANSKSSAPPHIFALAEDTYRTMLMEEESQCVIISGESGAGKTEASKQIMQYVAAVSGNSEEMQRVKEIMLESNPLLEAFGNAKTVRNDNSSRFGKFFEIYFDRVGGPVGGRMSNFLLEKSRVVKQQRGERNFHVFYQLCAGADASLRSRLKLKSASEFYFLNQGNTLERAGVNDAEEWTDTLRAMTKMGIDQERQSAIFGILGSILHLGEIKFSLKPGSEEAQIVNPEAVQFCASLLGVDVAALSWSFCNKRLEMGTEVVNVPLDLQQASNARDALAKFLYDKLFDFVVASVNAAFGKKSYALMLGVLDIYGFEIFDRNGFEQFCINYVNEKLQQIFIELTLKVEQEEYVREKIAWEEIKFFNNKIVCDLIEGRQPPGIFAILDDVCATMAKEKEAVADIKMLDKLEGPHGSHHHFQRYDRGFLIRHYAGDVQYDAAGFTTRNKDLLSADVVGVMVASTVPFIKAMTDDIEVDVPGSPKSGAKKKSTTAGFKIRQQAADLVKTLMSCTPHYVRTIKSNDEKAPNLIDDARVTHQVKYLGLLENIRVRRAGFAYRQYFEKFIRRFKYVCPDTFPRPFRGPDKQACQKILEYCASKVPREHWQLGESKVFIRHPQVVFALEELRERAFDDVARKIQRRWMKFRNNREFIVLKRNMDKIYAKGQKERRSDSVFRPFQGQFIDYHTSLTQFHALVDYDPIAAAWKDQFSDTGKKFYFNVITQVSQWTRPPEMDKQRVIYTDKVNRVVNHQAGIKREEILLVTDRNIIFVEDAVQTITPVAQKPTKAVPKPLAPVPYQIRVAMLHKKLDLRLLSGLSVSALADPFLVLHFYPAPVPYRNIVQTPQKGATVCEITGTKMKPTDKKVNCAGCGRVALLTALTQARPLPTLGFPQPVRVCDYCMTGEPYEPVEDVVLLSPQKTEIAAMIRRVYKQVMGNKIPINISNTISYSLSGEPQPRTATFMASAAKMDDATLYVNPEQLVIHVPPGISQARIDSIEAERQRRSIIAQERLKKEREEAKLHEDKKEREREEQRRLQVEERKRQKKEAEEREESDRIEKERQARERQAQSAQKVAAMRN